MAAVLKAILIVVGFLCITAPLACYVWFREMMWPVAAYHVMDIPKEEIGRLGFFGRASWSIPVLWLLSALLIIMEAATRRRWRSLLFYAAVPFVGGAIYWLAWQGYLIYLFSLGRLPPSTMRYGLLNVSLLMTFLCFCLAAAFSVRAIQLRKQGLPLLCGPLGSPFNHLLFASHLSEAGLRARKVAFSALVGLVLFVGLSYSLVTSNKNDYGTELKRQVAQDRGPHWLFVPHGNVDLSAEEVRLISEWLTAHDTGWEAASVLDFSPSKTQFLTANCVIEIDGNRVVVTYMRDENDNGSAVYIQRPISPDEQSFWNRITTAAKSTNQPVRRTGWQR